VGWRWTLLVPVPVVLVGRLLVVRAAEPDPSEQEDHRPLGRTLLIPLGVAALVLGGGWWPLPVVGAAVALVGVATIMPTGTVRLVRGTQAALGALLLFAVGYFGADSLITVLLTEGYHTNLAHAAIVLSAAPLAWALTSLLVSRFMHGKDTARLPAFGLALTSVGVTALAVTLLFTPLFGVALGGWTVAGVGIGLAYPGLYIRSTTAGSSRSGPVELAATAITAEAFGQLLGRAAGGVISSLAGAAGLVVSYLMFAVFLVFAALVAIRAQSADE
jgi:hypothetical protein